MKSRKNSGIAMRIRPRCNLSRGITSSVATVWSWFRSKELEELGEGSNGERARTLDLMEGKMKNLPASMASRGAVMMTVPRGEAPMQRWPRSGVGAVALRGEAECAVSQCAGKKTMGRLGAKCDLVLLRVPIYGRSDDRG